MCTAPRLSISHPDTPRRRLLMYRQLRKVAIGSSDPVVPCKCPSCVPPANDQRNGKEKETRCNDLLL